MLQVIDYSEIKQRAAALNLTPRQLGRLAGVKPWTIYSAEAGRDIRRSSHLALTRALLAKESAALAALVHAYPHEASALATAALCPERGRADAVLHLNLKGAA
jgi:hypothetical protein